MSSASARSRRRRKKDKHPNNVKTNTQIINTAHRICYKCGKLHALYKCDAPHCYRCREYGHDYRQCPYHCNFCNYTTSKFLPSYHNRDKCASHDKAEKNKGKDRSQLQLKLTYDIRRRSHDGYCSDPGESYEEPPEIEVKYVDVPDYLDADDFDEFGELTEFTEAFKNQFNTQTCWGSGYCGGKCGITKLVVKAVLVKAVLLKKTKKMPPLRDSL